MRHLGQQIRNIRQKKGIGLNTFASQLGVSAGYLSNLETGKTDTIHLSLLEKLQSELTLFPNFDQEDETISELSLRIQRIHQLLKQLETSNPEVANYLLSIVEQGIEVFIKDSNPSSI